MTFKTMKHLYDLLEDELDQEERMVKQALERVKRAKAELKSGLETGTTELEGWKAAVKRHSQNVNMINEMLEDMEHTEVLKASE